MIAFAAGLWLVGAVAAVPALWWFARDFGAIPRRVWHWSGRNRRPWLYAVGVGTVAGVWPAIAIVAAWWRSADRTELLAELAAYE